MEGRKPECPAKITIDLQMEMGIWLIFSLPPSRDKTSMIS